MNFDWLEIAVVGFGIAVILSTLFLSVRYFVCLVRSERRTPWSFPLGLGWLMVLLSVFIPPRVTDTPWEMNLPGEVAGEAFIIIITLLWCWAMAAYVLTISSWSRRPYGLQ